MMVILKEVGKYNFNDPTFRTLKDYFDRCRSETPSYTQSLPMEGFPVSPL